MPGEVIEIRPQPGAQEQFLASPADIVIYGGAAGGGKSFALLLEPLRHATTVKDFYAVIFRRNAVQLRYPGGLWDGSLSLYSMLGGEPREQPMEWSWKNAGKVKFWHLDDVNSVQDWQGAQVALIEFDELTHFEESQFFYMLSRNRSTCGVRPYIRATCNPDPDSWVAKLIAWWIDQKTGLPIPERAGVLRWFVRINDQLHWADTAEALIAKHGPDTRPKSLTFVPAKLEDNQILKERDPEYEANLRALPEVEQQRLLGGNWKIRRHKGIIERDWLQLWPRDRALPAFDFIVLSLDTAFTERTRDKKTGDADYSAAVALGLFFEKNRPGIVILDCWQERLGFPDLIDRVKDDLKVAYGEDDMRPVIKSLIGPNRPAFSGRRADLLVIEDKGSGISLRQTLAREAIFAFAYNPGRADKLTRLHAVSHIFKGGYVYVVESNNTPGTPRSWVEPLIAQLTNFTGEGSIRHDDLMDACVQGVRVIADRNNITLAPPKTDDPRVPKAREGNPYAQ